MILQCTKSSFQWCVRCFSKAKDNCSCTHNESKFIRNKTLNIENLFKEVGHLGLRIKKMYHSQTKHAMWIAILQQYRSALRNSLEAEEPFQKQKFKFSSKPPHTCWLFFLMLIPLTFLMFNEFPEVRKFPWNNFWTGIKNFIAVTVFFFLIYLNGLIAL